jgi:5'-3' exonuclease
MCRETEEERNARSEKERKEFDNAVIELAQRALRIFSEDSGGGKGIRNIFGYHADDALESARKLVTTLSREAILKMTPIDIT